MTMNVLNREAMKIPSDKLVEALEERIAAKRAVLEERDRLWGKNRVLVGSYMENLALPELFGFDMNEIFEDPGLALDIELRYRIFWLDNSHDDWNSWLGMPANAGKYFDMTLFGMEVRHTAQGVPLFMPHPVAQKPDLSLFKPFDFRTTGEMPNLIRHYKKLKELSHTRYGDKVKIYFPSFRRGPLDIYIQMRGYEGFIEDVYDNPEFAREFLAYIVNERARWNRERADFLGEKFPADSTYVADDWLNVPFITPRVFEEFIVPAYEAIQRAEGNVTGFHTCGVLTPVAKRLLEIFPAMKTLEVSGWNDFAELDKAIDPEIGFHLNFINTFVLTASETEHRRMLSTIARIAEHRHVSLCVQAIVRMHETFDETIERMNRFIDLAHEMLRV